MRHQNRISKPRKFLFITFSAPLLISQMPHALACADWEKEREETFPLEIKDLRWDGENLSLRYWRERNRGFGYTLNLSYWTPSGVRQFYEASEDNLILNGADRVNEWNSFSAQLRQKPDRVLLTATVSHCEKFREPTMWEKFKW